MSRASIIRGPAIIQFEGETFYSQGDITLTETLTPFAINVSQFGGKVDDRPDQIMHTLSFIPSGRWQALGVLFPYATALPGSSVFGGTDSPLTIWTLAGRKRVYKCAAVTQMPGIRLGSIRTLFDAVQFTCIHADASQWVDANSLFTDSTEAFPGHTGFDVADIITQPYVCAYGSIPWNEFYTKEGIDINFALTLAPETNDRKGLFDMTFQSLDVTALLQPDGISPEAVSTILNHQGAGAVRGKSLSAGKPNLDITGTDVFVRLYKASAILANKAFSTSLREVGQMEFRAGRGITAGAADPLFYVGASDPDEV